MSELNKLRRVVTETGKFVHLSYNGEFKYDEMGDAYLAGETLCGFEVHLVLLSIESDSSYFVGDDVRPADCKRCLSLHRNHRGNEENVIAGAL